MMNPLTLKLTSKNQGRLIRPVSIEHYSHHFTNTLLMKKILITLALLHLASGSLWPIQGAPESSSCLKLADSKTLSRRMHAWGVGHLADANDLQATMNA
jgi:hypothetical protein